MSTSNSRPELPSASPVEPHRIFLIIWRTCSAVKRGDRIAQLILERIMTPEVVEVDDLETTVRGAGGFGSTGVGSLGG